MKANFTINLAPLDSKDCDKIRAWRNDYRIWKWCRQNDLISDHAQQRWFDAQDKDQKIKMYRIETGLDGNRQMVGVCGLTDIDLINRRAEFSLYIGPEFHGHGYGEEALKLLLQQGFLHYGLNVIWGETYKTNPAMKTFARVGFLPEGARRQFYYREGEFIDAIIISITRKEWELLHGTKNNASAAMPNDGVKSGANVVDDSVIEAKPPQTTTGSEPNTETANVTSIQSKPRRKAKAKSEHGCESGQT